jgi:hypothetical protein
MLTKVIGVWNRRVKEGEQGRPKVGRRVPFSPEAAVTLRLGDPVPNVSEKLTLLAM